MPETKQRGTYVVLPLLRVRANADGELDAVPPADLAPYETNEGWWESALRDFRVRPRKKTHFDPLGLLARRETITIACQECNLRREFAVAELLKRYGRAYYTTYLRYDLAECPKGRRFRDCAVRYVNEIG